MDDGDGSSSDGEREVGEEEVATDSTGDGGGGTRGDIGGADRAAMWEYLEAFNAGGVQADTATAMEAVRPAGVGTAEALVARIATLAAGGAGGAAGAAASSTAATPAAAAGAAAPHLIDARDVLTRYPFPVLFAVLASVATARQQRQVATVVAALDRLVRFALAAAPDVYATALVPVAAAALSAGDVTVRGLAAATVARIAALPTYGAWHVALAADVTLTRLMRALRDPEAVVAESVTACLLALSAAGSSSPGGGHMGAVVAAVAGLERTLPATPAAAAEDADPDGTSIVRGRVLAVAARLVGSSEAGAEEVAAAGLLARLLAAASDTTDVLLCLSTLELVGTMVATAAGMAAVVDAGLWAALTAWAGVGAPAAGEEEERGAEAALLAPAALAAAAAVYAAAAKHMPGALPALRDSLLPGLFRVVAAAC